MADLREYKCPCCSGAVRFDSALQKMKCPYCDTEFDIEMLKEYDEQLNNEAEDDMQWDSLSDNEWEEAERSALYTYICQSCGGEIIGEQTTAATQCPYCGNPVVMMGNLTGVLRPDYVIPFQLDKKAAKEAFKNHLLKKRLLPKLFKEEAHIDEIKGVYVPFWLFDTDVYATLRCRATRVRRYSDSRYYYTETNYYSAFRGGNISFDHVPVDGSQKMTDELMESLEPYDFRGAVDFQTAYLAGYFADKYDIGAQQSVLRANQRIKRSAEDAFLNTVAGYTTVIPESSSVKVLSGQEKYALYPVWILNTTWNGQTYMFAMNAQTGKFVGNLPIDKKAAAAWFLGLAGGFSVLLYVLSWLLWLFEIL